MKFLVFFNVINLYKSFFLNNNRESNVKNNILFVLLVKIFLAFEYLYSVLSVEYFTFKYFTYFKKKNNNLEDFYIYFKGVLKKASLMKF